VDETVVTIHVICAITWNVAYNAKAESLVTLDQIGSPIDNDTLNEPTPPLAAKVLPSTEHLFSQSTATP
jgi:hypothetical protein